MTPEQLEAIRSARAEIAASRKRLMEDRGMLPEERAAEAERLVNLTARESDLVAASAAPPPPRADRKAALAELRKDPALNDPNHAGHAAAVSKLLALHSE
ncbi:MAG: hypothetical protein QM704_25420 [Anaeromyxobacteraceae bacterium]